MSTYYVIHRLCTSVFGVFLVLGVVSLQCDVAELGRTHFVEHESFGRPDYPQYVRRCQANVDTLLDADGGVPQQSTAVDHGVVRAFFSQRDGLKEALLECIDNEQRQLDIAAYVLNDKAIAQALREAADRGVRVRVLVDKQVLTGNSSKLDMLRDHPAISIHVYNPTKKGASTSLMHNKFVLFYAQPELGPCVWTGSANFTNQALSGKNQENVILLPDRATHREYADYFEGLIETTKEQQAGYKGL